MPKMTFIVRGGVRKEVDAPVGFSVLDIAHRNDVDIEGARISTRIETDTFGPIEVPADRLWGAQTQRSLQNFRIGTERMPLPLVHALALVKQASALVNRDLGQLEPRLAEAIVLP